ncbi:MAG: ABC transporter substrate-binding protein [Candidatus Adiutrix sp.]|jgi:peptide/nickel transport system substrate-binding protein|nr:ABC transporter substrate-binding protein [Candidatus Adiutrix sp.]
MKTLKRRFVGAVLLALGAVFAAGAAWAATPKDVLVVGVSSDPSTLDPAVTIDNFDMREIFPVYDRLVQYKVVNGLGTTAVEPMAAESWFASQDGLTWTFKLKPGITFSDQTPLDADAVKYSIDRMMAIKMGPAGNFDSLDSVTVIDPLTVRFNLKHPFAPFLQVLATNGGSIVNPKTAKKAKGDDLAQGWLAQNMDGSGPYRLKEWLLGERLVLEARPGYWGPAPALKQIIIRIMREPSDRRLALEKGDIDITESILVDQLPQLEKNPAVRIGRYDGQFVEYVYLNNTRAPLNDKRVRQALSYAVDYRGLIDHVLQGYGAQMRGPVPSGMWGHNPKAFQYKRDVAKAKELLKEAGYGNGLTLTLIYSERRATWEQIATLLQSNFAEIGVDLKLEMMANPALRDRVANKNYELCLGAWSPDFGDPYMFANLWFDSQYGGMPGNRSYYSNPEVDQKLRRAAEAGDADERLKLYTEVQDTVIEEAPYIYLYQLKAIVPMRKEVEGFVFNPLLESMYNFATMRKR